MRACRVVVRLSSDELSLVQERAQLAGLAVGAWIGQIVVDAADEETPLVALLRLHADVVAARAVGLPAREAALLLERLDRAIDAVLSEVPAVITKVVHGWRVGGLIAYLMGPGRAQEHLRPRVIASWDGRDAFWQPSPAAPRTTTSIWVR